MTGIADVPRRVRGVDIEMGELWVSQGWVRPSHRQGSPVFEEIDIARVRLIVELRDDMGLEEPAIPVVLSLLDQLHAARSEMRRLCEVLEAARDQPVQAVLRQLGRD